MGAETKPTQNMTAPKHASSLRHLVFSIYFSALLLLGALAGSAFLLTGKLNALSARLTGFAGPRPEGMPQEPAEKVAPPLKVDAATILRDDDPWLGSNSGKISVIVFSDYQCPDCKSFFEESFPSLVQKYRDKVRFVWKDFPRPAHAYALKAAEAAHCAGDQKKYWEYHALLFQQQISLQPEYLKMYADQLMPDSDQFSACLDSGKYAKKVRADISKGRGIGLNTTPSFIINGERLMGPRPLAELELRIDQALRQK